MCTMLQPTLHVCRFVKMSTTSKAATSKSTYLPTQRFSHTPHYNWEANHHNSTAARFSTQRSGIKKKRRHDIPFVLKLHRIASISPINNTYFAHRSYMFRYLNVATIRLYTELQKGIHTIKPTNALALKLDFSHTSCHNCTSVKPI